MSLRSTTALRDLILSSLDARFAMIGHQRRAGRQVWHRAIDAERSHGVHLHFGLYENEGRVTVIPSIGVRYASIEDALLAAAVVRGANARDRVTFSKPLGELSGAEYQTDLECGAEGIATRIWTDVETYGLPFLRSISDLEEVIALLASPEPRDWCCPGPGLRARLLVLALDGAGRRSDALELLDGLWADLLDRDAVVPPFERFAAWFRLGGSCEPIG